MPRSPLNTKIHEAIGLLEANPDVPLTPATVRANLQPGWDDVQNLAERTIMNAIRDQLKAAGHVITDSAPQPGGRPRKDFWDCTPDELEEQKRIQEESASYDRNRTLALEAVIKFLREKERELQYKPYPGLFEADIDRIYSMHGLSAPGSKQAA